MDAVHAKANRSPHVSDIEPEASSEALRERLANRLMPPIAKPSLGLRDTLGQGLARPKLETCDPISRRARCKQYLDRSRLASQDYERTEL